MEGSDISHDSGTPGHPFAKAEVTSALPFSQSDTPFEGDISDTDSKVSSSPSPSSDSDHQDHHHQVIHCMYYQDNLKIQVDFCKDRYFVIYISRLNKLRYGRVRCMSCRQGPIARLRKWMIVTLLIVKMT